jgi:hypothetical protein
MKFSKTYPSPRALAIEAGLAVPGRGRLRREAIALVDEARRAGVTFESEIVAPPVLDEDLAPEEPEGIPDELRNGFHYARLPGAGNTKEALTFTGETVEGFKVSWSTCHRCSQFSAHCECTQDPQPPIPVTHVTSKPWTND